MVDRTVIKRIPGNLPPPPKKENQGYIEDLGTLQKFQLDELLARQNKLLANKYVEISLKILLNVLLSNTMPIYYFY